MGQAVSAILLAVFAYKSLRTIYIRNNLKLAIVSGLLFLTNAYSETFLGFLSSIGKEARECVAGLPFESLRDTLLDSNNETLVVVLLFFCVTSIAQKQLTVLRCIEFLFVYISCLILLEPAVTSAIGALVLLLCALFFKIESPRSELLLFIKRPLFRQANIIYLFPALILLCFAPLNAILGSSTSIGNLSLSHIGRILVYICLGASLSRFVMPTASVAHKYLPSVLLLGAIILLMPVGSVSDVVGPRFPVNGVSTAYLVSLIEVIYAFYCKINLNIKLRGLSGIITIRGQHVRNFLRLVTVILFGCYIVYIACFGK